MAGQSTSTENASEDENLTPKRKRMYRSELTKEEKSKNCRKQLFSESWLNDDRFKGWLQPVVDRRDQVKCVSCNLLFGSKKSDIVRHSQSKRHTLSVVSLQNVNKLSFEPKSTKQQDDIKKSEMQYSLSVVCHNLSFRSIDHLSQLPSLSFPDSKLATLISLKRTKCIKIIKNVLSSVIEENMIKELADKKFSIYLDESTDISNIKLLAILAKFISNKQIQTHLLDIVPVDADHGKAIGLYTLFKKSLHKLKLNTNNIVGYCSDNASVMMGCNESFKTHLLNDNPNIIVNVCICHSAHLIASAATSCILGKIEILLQNISSYFSRSPKIKSILVEFQQFMKESVVKILSPSQTRWLVLSKCVNRILSQRDVLTELFRLATHEDKNPVANLIFQELHILIQRHT